MSAVASSNPISSTFCIRNIDFSQSICSVPSSSRHGSGKIYCSGVIIDPEKIKTLLNTKGKPPAETRTINRIRRKETPDFKRKPKVKENAVKDFFAEDSPFKAAFQDYVKLMDNVKRSRDQKKKEQEDVRKKLIADESGKKSVKDERMKLKANCREGKKTKEKVRLDFQSRVRFKEFKSKKIKHLNATNVGVVSDEEFNLKPGFRVSKDSMREFVKDSLDLNAKVGLRSNLERGMKTGEIKMQGNGVKKNAGLKGTGLGKLGVKKLGDTKLEHVRVDGVIKVENKAFQFCTETGPWVKPVERIRQLAQQLNDPQINMSMWKFSELMYSSKIKFTDYFINHLVQDLGDMGNWRRALQVIEWLRSQKRYKSYSRRNIYTTVLSILGKAGRPAEALNMFHAMREEFSTYPDMPAYHCIAVTLGQAGYIKELLDLMDCMEAGPEKTLENVPLRHWNPCLQPDLVIYNALVNACVHHKEWQGAFWVLQRMRHSGIKPNSATYGLVMEVMLKSGKYDLVHEIFEKMDKSGMIPNALTYKALVQACWKEGKIDEAVVIVGEMERRGIVGTASLYYDFSCCLCSAGRFQDALLQVEKIRRVAKKPLYVTYTGLIKACMESGHLQDCISIFDHMQKFCAPNIITCNLMMKLFGDNQMFKEAKSLFEGIKKGRIFPCDSGPVLTADIITYNAMLEACVAAKEWDYFENVFQDMLLKGYQLDNKQHSLFIVAASRAGKGHLLNNAYERLVELGRTPHVSLYKELIGQNLQRGEYAKTLAYVSRMAYAKLNIRKSEWMEFFEKNSDRISKENLQGLLNEVNSFIGVNGQSNFIFKTFINSLQLVNEQWTQANATIQAEAVATTN